MFDFNWRVFLIGVAWWLLETDYFGWNARPGSVAELFADGGAGLVCAPERHRGRVCGRLGRVDPVDPPAVLGTAETGAAIRHWRSAEVEQRAFAERLGDDAGKPESRGMRGQHPNSRANLRPDNLRGRRSPRMNLHRDGYEAVAEAVSAKARRNITLLQVHVAPDGGVYTSPERKLLHAPMLELIGTYNREVRVEHVEDDLIFWMRKQMEQAA